MKKYIDARGWKYQVMSGLGQNTYKARYQKPDKHVTDGWHCVKTLPWQSTPEAAQADLDRLAEKNRWREWNGI